MELNLENSLWINNPLPQEHSFCVRVLLVEFDEVSLLDLENKLKSCGHEVTKTGIAEEALVILRSDKQNHHQIVVTSIDEMPGDDRFRLLRTVSSEMKLPIVVVSQDGNNLTRYIATSIGCCDYLVKPVSEDSVRTIWQHVVRHRMKADLDNNNNNTTGLVEPGDGKRLLIRVKREKESESEDRSGGLIVPDHRHKKTRLVWTEELHEKFMEAVNDLGSKAVPKKILEHMIAAGCVGLTREHIASHLQKYRQLIGKGSGNSLTPHNKNSLINDIYEVIETKINRAQNPIPLLPNLSFHENQTNYELGFQSMQMMNNNVPPPLPQFSPNITQINNAMHSNFLAMQPQVEAAQHNPWIVNHSNPTTSVQIPAPPMIHRSSNEIQMECNNIGISYNLDDFHIFDGLPNLEDRDESGPWNYNNSEFWDNNEVFQIENCLGENTTSDQPQQDLSLVSLLDISDIPLLSTTRSESKGSDSDFTLESLRGPDSDSSVT